MHDLPQDPRAVAQAYRLAALENSPPIKIVRMLYEGALRFLDQAAAIGPQSPEFARLCARADAIVNELRCSLDPEPAPGLARDLDRLYLFVQDRIAQATIGRTSEPLPAGRQVMATLLEGWQHVELSTSGNRRA